MKKKSVTLLMLLFTANSYIFSQSFAINTDGSAANASALLDVKSSIKGVLVPRMTRTERNGIASPATGLLIFQNAPDSIGFYYYNGSRWTWIISNANADSLAWKTGGNTGTADASSFVGTRDNVALNFRVNNQKSGRIDPAGPVLLGYQSGYNNSTSNFITGIGFQALFANTTGNYNTALGYGTLDSNSSGNNNTAIGHRALFLNNTGTDNVAVGSPALYFNTTASHNIAIGNQALYSQSYSNSNTPWNSENVAVGDSALYANQPTANSNGYLNTAIGSRALRNNTTGYQNTAVGNLTLFNNTSGQLNTAGGWAALYKNTGGQYNTTNGAMAMYYNTTGSYNTAVGSQALHNNVTGSNNTIIGDDAGLGVLNNSYSNNTILGYQSGYSLTTGSNNVFIGYRAGYSETTGSNKLYIANSSVNPPLIYGDFSTGRVGINTITPAEKLEVNGNLLLSGTGTIYSGAGQTNMIIHSGDGTGSGGTMTIRGGNAGVSAGGAGGDLILSAGANLPAGGAGYSGLGATGNVTINAGSGYNTTGGSISIKAGATSCWSLANGTHSDVTIQGGQNYTVTDAASIVCEGGYVNGAGACGSGNSNGGNLILKSGIQDGTGTAGNIQLLNGNVGIGTTTPSQRLHVAGNICYTGGIAACSDKRYKTNIVPLKNNLKSLMQLNPVNYYMKVNEFPDMNFTNKKQIGFIAQDVEKLFPEIVFTDEKGYKSIDYSKLTPVLVETVKEQQQQIEEIKKQNALLLTRLERLESKQKSF